LLEWTPARLSPANLFPSNLFLEPRPPIYFFVVDVDQSNGLHFFLSVMITHPPSDHLPQVGHGCFGRRPSAREFRGAAKSLELDFFDHVSFVHGFSFVTRRTWDQRADRSGVPGRASMFAVQDQPIVPSSETNAAKHRAPLSSPKYNQFGGDGTF
jgi:hypothetical protein